MLSKKNISGLVNFDIEICLVEIDRCLDCITWSSYFNWYVHGELCQKQALPLSSLSNSVLVNLENKILIKCLNIDTLKRQMMTSSINNMQINFY